MGLEQLSEAEKVASLVSYVDFEVALGGLDSFYYNSAGDEAVHTVAALEAIGATRAASALRSANALFPGGSTPRDRGDRFDGLLVVRKLPGKPLEILEREFSGDEPCVNLRLYGFIEAHAAELREHGA